MRVLFLALSLQPTGGLERYSRTMAQTISELGHHVEVWSVFENDSAEHPGLPQVRYCAPRGRVVASLHFRARSLWLLKELFPRTQQFDLLIAAHPMLVKGTYLASLIKPDLRYIVCTYGSDIWLGFDRMLYKGFLRATSITAISEYTRGAILKRIPSASVQIVYPAVGLEYSSVEVQLDRRRIPPVMLTVGRLNKEDAYKGHDVVIRAMPEIQDRLGSPISYRIVGDGDGIPALRTLAEKCDVASAVEFLGKIDDEQLRSEYCNCDVFVMPSRMEKCPDGSFSGEGFGIVYIEAAACGKPVIGSDQGGAPEAFMDGVTGIAVNPTSVTEIVDAVCRVIADPMLANRMGEAGKRFVKENFSMAAFRKRVAEILEDVS